MSLDKLVAPFVGAWIEIRETFTIKEGYAVAPFVGAWIEIRFVNTKVSRETCRSVRRSVD